MKRAVVYVSLLAPAVGFGQTITISGGVQTYESLTNTTVNLIGPSELRITGTNNPIAGCTINLNDTNAFFVMQNLKPSAVVASYLAPVRVFGAAAVADSNCRVVEYGMGAVVVPHAPSFQPLQVFSGPYFKGVSAKLSQYVYYTGTGLGALDATISSFKLKRGYMATLAQNTSGSGLSKCYVAADGDMEVSVLPPGLDNKVRFVYVTPWRWTSKKGIAGDPGIPLLNVQWWYNWNLDQNSSRDLEYVAIRQNQFWPSLSQNWQSRGINTVLGYNEPDSSSQANMSVGTAISAWPDLLGTGLRVGSPATTDGGWSSWLYPFLSQADASNLRVDFVAVHYYRCFNPADPNGAANQMYNALKGIYDNVKRPLWITEWNNGANWTSCADPTYDQQQACIAAMINMLDSTPFVERYALYSWVEEVRQVTTNNVLTPAGVTYRDQRSPIGYVQALHANGTRSFTQLRFENNLLDTSGYGNNGIASGSPVYAAGTNGQALVFDGSNTVVTLPPNVATNSAFSFAAWVYWNGGAQWQRIFDFGNSTTHYMFLTPRSGNNTLRFAIANGGSEQRVETAGPLPAGQWVHVAFTLNGATGALYTNGLLAASASVSITPASFNPIRNCLGKSQFTADPLFGGALDEVQIADFAFSTSQIRALMTNQPPQFATNFYDLGTATPFVSFSNSIAGAASDPEGDPLTYSKATGPAWLTVSPSGIVSGTPGSGDGGTNYFTARVNDPSGASDFAVLAVYVPITYASGTWISDADGDWGDSGNWLGGTNANGAGFTANFSAMNITADRTVTLDQPRSIGTLTFGDTSGSENWTLISHGDALTLDSGTTATPGVVVTRNAATLALPLVSAYGLNKSGAGTLILASDNSMSGAIQIDNGSTTAYEGAVRAASPGAFGSVTNIAIRTNNGGSSTLQLDGSAGNITVTAKLNVSCRNNDVPTIQNVAGTNTIAGFVQLDVGGNRFNIVCDSGLLIFANTNRYLGALVGSRSYVFTGAGDFLVTGPILNATNSSPVSLSKTGSGTLRLNAVNAYTNGTTVGGGRLLVNGTVISNLTVLAGGTLGGTGFVKGPVSIQAGGTLSPGEIAGLTAPNFRGLTISNSLTLGGTAFFRLNKAGNTNDSVRVTGATTYGGTLAVTNVGGTLASGDSYRLFNNGSFAGSFSAMNLPPVSPGLGWSFNPNNGFLSVVTVGPTNPSGLTATAGDAQVALSWNALSGATSYYVKSSTNSGGPYTIIGNPAGTNFTHAGLVNGATYYYVVSGLNAGGESANSAEVSATPLSAFQAWALAQFGCWNCPQADPAADPDGDGQDNNAEFLAGTDPTNSASAFRILSVAPAGDDMVVTWQGGAGRTGAVQAVDGVYSTNFADISGPIVIPGGGVTNYPDAGAATNAASRFYRVRLVP